MGTDIRSSERHDMLVHICTSELNSASEVSTFQPRRLELAS